MVTLYLQGNGKSVSDIPVKKYFSTLPHTWQVPCSRDRIWVEISDAVKQPGTMDWTRPSMGRISLTGNGWVPFASEMTSR